MEIKNLVYIFILLVVIYFLTQKITIEKIENIADMNAAEACKKISTKAEEIEAHYDGAAKIVDAAWGWMSPKNYKSGDNKSTDMMRNIINTNMSQDDITKISNDCAQTASNVQVNEIDMTQCPYCMKNSCDVMNVTQENISKSVQTCGMQSAIDVLMSKTNSIDAQALAQTLQKAQGVMSGSNTSKKENCNIINTDMSSKEYMEVRGSCAQSLSLNQENKIKGCGAVMNVIQRNISEQVQDCIIGNTVKKETQAKSDTKVKTEMKSEQITEGISPLASLGSSLSCVLSSCVISIAAYFIMNSDTAKEAINTYAESKGGISV
jgi:hypothetical protein